MENSASHIDFKQIKQKLFWRIAEQNNNFFMPPQVSACNSATHKAYK